jgi:hypothetical protein
MGRKPTDEELNDPDFQALLAALDKVSKPIGQKPAKARPSPQPQSVAGKPEPASSGDMER